MDGGDDTWREQRSVEQRRAEPGPCGDEARKSPLKAHPTAGQPQALTSVALTRLKKHLLRILKKRPRCDVAAGKGIPGSENSMRKVWIAAESGRGQESITLRAVRRPEEGGLP